MTEVFTDPDFTKVGFLKSTLDAAGIACFIQNQHTNTMMTGVPTALFWPVDQCWKCEAPRPGRNSAKDA